MNPLLKCIITAKTAYGVYKHCGLYRSTIDAYIDTLERFGLLSCVHVSVIKQGAARVN